MGPWYVNRGQCNVVIGLRNVIMGPRNVNRRKWDVIWGPVMWLRDGVV